MGWVLLWLMGVPPPLLAILYLLGSKTPGLRKCSASAVERKSPAVLGPKPHSLGCLLT
jgi:hypothetical protein